MHLDNSLQGSRCRAPWARAARALAYSGSLWLAACGTLRTELCTSVHIRMLEELRTSEGTAGSVKDPWECERNARQLRALAEALRDLEHRDTSLREALEGYSTQVEGLAEAYSLLADAYQSSAQLPPAQAEQVRQVLSHGVLKHVDALNEPRVALQRACGTP